ncbi:MAG: hypothetical protein M1476_03375 [Candidatus Thermoplasmatota archaeon]|nr:hypothetical protein [Candidatus Thermoplasmatota archaeon]
METYEWTSRTGKRYVTSIQRVEGVRFWKQPEYATICLDTKTAYCRSIDWAVIARKYAEEHGIGKITVKLVPLRDPDIPKKKPGRVKGSPSAKAWGRKMRAIKRKKQLERIVKDAGS